MAHCCVAKPRKSTTRATFCALHCIQNRQSCLAVRIIQRFLRAFRWRRHWRRDRCAGAAQHPGAVGIAPYFHPFTLAAVSRDLERPLAQWQVSSILMKPSTELESTLAERAHRKLRADIISGALLADQALRLEYLKERYGISYSPLREALNRLHSEQLVVSSPSRGFRVSPFSEAHMWDAIETRIVIDCEALRRALVRGDAAWEEKLLAAFDMLIPLSESGAEARHYDFHRALISACGSHWLLTLSDQLYGQTERYRQTSLRGRTSWNIRRDSTAEHRQLLHAAVARDAVLAAGLLARHYRQTGRMVQQVLAMTE